MIEELTATSFRIIKRDEAVRLLSDKAVYVCIHNDLFPVEKIDGNVCTFSNDHHSAIVNIEPETDFVIKVESPKKIKNKSSKLLGDAVRTNVPATAAEV